MVMTTAGSGGCIRSLRPEEPAARGQRRGGAQPSRWIKTSRTMPGASALNTTRIGVESPGIRFSTLGASEPTVHAGGNRDGCLPACSSTTSRSPTLRSTVLPSSLGPTVTMAGEGEAVVASALTVRVPGRAQPATTTRARMGKSCQILPARPCRSGPSCPGHAVRIASPRPASPSRLVSWTLPARRQFPPETLPSGRTAMNPGPPGLSSRRADDSRADGDAYVTAPAAPHPSRDHRDDGAGVDHRGALMGPRSASGGRPLTTGTARERRPVGPPRLLLDAHVEDQRTLMRILSRTDDREQRSTLVIGPQTDDVALVEISDVEQTDAPSSPPRASRHRSALLLSR
jgi:hypothetical protein